MPGESHRVVWFARFPSCTGTVWIPVGQCIQANRSWPKTFAIERALALNEMEQALESFELPSLQFMGRPLVGGYAQCRVGWIDERRSHAIPKKIELNCTDRAILIATLLERLRYNSPTCLDPCGFSYLDRLPERNHHVHFSD